MKSIADPEQLSHGDKRSVDISFTGRLRLYRRFAAGFLAPHAGKLLLAALSMLAYAGSIVALPVTFQRLVDDVLVKRDGTALPGLVLLIVCVFAVRGAGSFAQQFTLASVGNAVSLTMQRRLADHLLSLDLSFFHKNSIGQVISRATDDVAVLDRSAILIVTMLGRDLVTLIGLIGYIVWTDPLWSLMAFVGGPLIGVPVSLANRKMRALAHRAQNLSGEILQAFEEGLHAIRTIKAENLEDLERRRIFSIIGNRRRVALRLARTQAFVLPLVDFVTAAALVTVVLLGGSEVVRGEADPGHLIAFATALMLLYDPLRRVLQLNAQLQAAAVSLHRIYEVLDLRPRIVDRLGAQPLRDPGGAIRFENVDFSYDGQSPVLVGFTAEIPEGATAALVGPSGTGKTTIFNLLARLYEPTGGRITIGGQDIAEVSLASLRSNLALVSQDVLLFDAAIGENIVYGVDDPRPEAVSEAMRAAEASAFVAQMPGGAEFRVGPRGARLSGGQRQRVALSRALLRDAPILLLDEASAALDSESEARIQASLARLRRGRTTLVIAHRLASVSASDVIFVVEEGRIIEHGSHDELIALQGAYARAFAQQSSDSPAIRG